MQLTTHPAGAGNPFGRRIAKGLSMRLRSVRRRLRDASALWRIYSSHWASRQTPKILYALTPTPGLRNIGDHAQAVAIHRWLAGKFPNRPVIELDKDEVLRVLPRVRKLITPQDVIIIHSGGNMGDRGIWSETGRRLVISSFPQNKIISLPQTIFFSDTETGRRERENTRAIYGRHPDLTVIGRDRVSGELAATLFPNARTFCAPDFVLSLPPRNSQNRLPRACKRVLLCLRHDDESILSSADREALAASLPYETALFDTNVKEDISRRYRASLVDRTLDLFSGYDAVVTDRYHGVIFSVLCNRPTVVLPTVDHKLTSAIDWFEPLSFVRFAPSIDAVPATLSECLAADPQPPFDWNETYFDRLLVQSGVAA